MIASSLLPLMIAAAFGLAAPVVGRRVRPGRAVWMLSAGGLLLALCEVAVFAGVAVLGVGQLPEVARWGHWSARLLSRWTPFQDRGVVVAVVVLSVCTVRAGLLTWRRGRRLLAAWSVSRQAPEGLIVLADDARFAYAVPGWPGRIAVSQGLLKDLDPAGRRAVLAHEETHLAERHDLHLAAAHLAAALNPLLVRVPAALQLACERRADEVAAGAVGDRRAVVRAIALAASPDLDTVAWAASGSDVALRVTELLRPSSRWGHAVSAVLVLAGLVAVLAAGSSVLWLGHDVRSVFAAARL
jgi:Zn-dependent protease with chaperone function